MGHRWGKVRQAGRYELLRLYGCVAPIVTQDPILQSDDSTSMHHVQQETGFSLGLYFERQIRGVKGCKRDSTDETEAGIGVRVASGEDQPAEDPDGLKALLGVTEPNGAAEGLMEMLVMTRNKQE